MDILIGADPEIFVKKDGNLVSAHNLIPGTKAKPYKVDKGAVQVDGMALEFNINPASSEDEFVANINTVMGCLKGMVPDHEFCIEPTAHFGKELIESQPEEARVLGCEPDYNAYTGMENPRPDAEFPFRTASGHVHIGWTKDMDPHDPEHFEACRMVTKQLDVMLGVPSLLWDRDKERRKLYGNFGAFRPKSYGCEYRVLSNLWLSNEMLTRFVYLNAHWAIDRLLKGRRYYEELDPLYYYKEDKAPWNNQVLQSYCTFGNTNTIEMSTYFQEMYREVTVPNKPKRPVKPIFDNAIIDNRLVVNPAVVQAAFDPFGFGNVPVRNDADDLDGLLAELALDAAR